jgi:threonine/homoserine/homoserine lactone efflux protein
VLLQTLLLGATELFVVLAFDTVTVMMAARVHGWFSVGAQSARRRAWARRALSGVFGALALRLALEQRR